MKVSKWGNSLAIRLPAKIVGALGLKAGDHIEIGVAGDRTFIIRPDPGLNKALAQISRLRRPLPPGFKFSRLEANARSGDSK